MGCFLGISRVLGELWTAGRYPSADFRPIRKADCVSRNNPPEYRGKPPRNISACTTNLLTLHFRLMGTKEDFPALEPQANIVSEPLTISMDTEPHPPSPEDLAKCTRMLDTHEYLMVKEAKLIQTNHYLMMVRTGILRKNQTTYDSMMKEADNHTMEIQRIKGELALFGICPIIDCQHHTKLNSPRMVKKIEDCTKQLQAKLANTHLTATVSGGNSSQTLKKNNRQDGFVTPAKVAKKQKLLQNYSFGAATPVTTTNQFQALTGSDALPTPDPTAVPVATPKIPHPP
ncbi:hypothetical protein TNCV_5072821 [Trichonephila clavipes]|nr:hypothetical protein TNCV_5072821 [Trichonephila clavipes]